MTLTHHWLKPREVCLPFMLWASKFETGWAQFPIIFVCSPGPWLKSHFFSLRLEKYALVLKRSFPMWHPLVLFIFYLPMSDAWSRINFTHWPRPVLPDAQKNSYNDYRARKSRENPYGRKHKIIEKKKIAYLCPHSAPVQVGASTNWTHFLKLGNEWDSLFATWHGKTSKHLCFGEMLVCFLFVCFRHILLTPVYNIIMSECI